MHRTTLSNALLALSTAAGICSSPTLAQQQHGGNANTRLSTPTPILTHCSPPGAMSLDGSFFTIPLSFRLFVSEFNLPAQWSTTFIDRGAGFIQGSIGAPAGPLPTGGVVFNANGRLIRWDPNPGITYMDGQTANPIGASPWPYNPTDAACGDRIMIVGNNGRLYARDVSGTNAWSDWGNFGVPFVGKPGLVEHLFTGETHAAVVEQSGRLWIIDDVCGLNGPPTWRLAGWGGPNAGLPGGNPLAYCTGVGAGLNGGKFYAIVEYWTGAPTDLYETSEDGPHWGWYNHGHPSWSSGFLSEPTAARDAVLILTQNAATGLPELALKYYDHSIGAWAPWVNLGSPPSDSIVPDTITSEQWANRVVVKGVSGRFWMCRNDGSGWSWYDLNKP